MTGEITLRGKVLPIGGLKEKVLAAHRAGISTFVLPSKNEKDLDEIPPKVLRGLRMVPVDDLDSVLGVALQPAPAVNDGKTEGGTEPIPTPKRTPQRRDAIGGTVRAT